MRAGFLFFSVSSLFAIRVFRTNPSAGGVVRVDASLTIRAGALITLVSRALTSEEREGLPRRVGAAARRQSTPNLGTRIN